MIDTSLVVHAVQLNWQVCVGTGNPSHYYNADEDSVVFTSISKSERVAFTRGVSTLKRDYPKYSWRWTSD